MHLRLDPQDGVPIHAQIVRQIRYLLASGRLSPGEEMPTVRGLAERLLVNANTVARAYRELERDGLVVTRAGAGTIVSPRLSPPDAAGVAALDAKADDLVRSASRHSFSCEDTLELVRRRHRELEGGTTS